MRYACKMGEPWRALVEEGLARGRIEIAEAVYLQAMAQRLRASLQAAPGGLQRANS
jgi:hypothetical protein